MFDLPGLPLTPDLAVAARKHCRLTQEEAAKLAGVPGLALKWFELRKALPELPTLRKIRSLYEKKGFVFPDAPKPGDSAKAIGDAFPAGVVAPGSASESLQVGRPYAAQVLHIRIDPALSMDDAGRILDHIERNERKLKGLLEQKIERTQLFGLAESAEALHGAIIRLLAENGTLVAQLFGRRLVGANEFGKVPATHAELLAKTQSDMLGAIAGKRKSLDAVEADRPVPATLAAAIFN